MNTLHEPVEMNALFALHRQVFIEKIHQPGFATANTSPNIQALDVDRLAPPDFIQKGWVALALQLMPQGVQGVKQFELGGI